MGREHMRRSPSYSVSRCARLSSGSTSSSSRGDLRWSCDRGRPAETILGDQLLAIHGAETLGWKKIIPITPQVTRGEEKGQKHGPTRG
jgi:hypothetical protein